MGWGGVNWGIGGGGDGEGEYPQGVVAYESEVEGLARGEGVGCEGVGERRAEVVGGFAEEGGVELGGEVG